MNCTNKTDINECHEFSRKHEYGMTTKQNLQAVKPIRLVYS